MTELRLGENMDFEVRLESVEGVNMEDIVERLEDAAYAEVADSPLSVIDRFMEFYFYDGDGAPIVVSEDDDTMIYGSLIGEARNVDSEQNVTYRAMRAFDLVGEVESVAGEGEEITVTLSGVVPRSNTWL